MRLEEQDHACGQGEKPSNLGCEHYVPRQTNHERSNAQCGKAAASRDTYFCLLFDGLQHGNELRSRIRAMRFRMQGKVVAG